MMASGAPAKDAEAFVRAARALAPTIRELRADIERDRSLPVPLVKRMADTGFFSLWLARALGGPELNTVDYLRVIEELSRADGAVGWCTMVSAGYSRLSGYLDDGVAREIFGDGSTIVAGTINPTGKAIVVPGGFRVSGRWSYGSFIGHSTWTVGSSIIHDNEGPRRGADGAPDMRLMLFPTSAVEIIDTWRVGGLRGTGSHDFHVTDLFVPDDHAIAAFTAKPVRPGTLYAAPFITVFAMAIASVPLGIARAAIEAFIALAEAKTPTGGASRLRDKAGAQADVGKAEALLRSARAFLVESAHDIWNAVEAGDMPSLPQRATARLAAAQAAAASAQAVDLLYNAAGGTALYENNLLERCFRDVHATTQHMGTSSANFELSGRVLLGLDPGTPRF
ncbi:MAG TPA: acyl-CoA dehydrogenase family protein [Xanthobacteraceae bacterium]|nr:acyl-CoA dehydrogenase family protein [Xanthobacteraceae bacterium]